jgi:hypothetical protein
MLYERVGFLEKKIMMRYERSDTERRMDDALLLALWSRAQQQAGGEAAGDRLKLMKLAFLAAYPLYRDNVKALNLRFYRWKWGPMATEVYSSIDDLTASGLLLEEEQYVVPDEGLRLAQSFCDEVLEQPENAPILRTLEDVAKTYGALPTGEILDRVYSMRCFAVGLAGRHQVKALPMRSGLTEILNEEEAVESLVVPPSWQVTLELALSRDALRNLQRGIEDTHEGRIYGWEAMWTNV